MKIEIFSDIVCPWCYLGQARLRTALAGFPGEVEPVWRPFQLDPSAPARGGGLADDWLREKFGGAERVAAAHARMRALIEAEGLAYAPEKALHVNSFQAHRALWLAGSLGGQDALAGRLFRAHHAEGLDVSDEETLVALASEAGLPGERVREMLASREGVAEVADGLERARALGISGVPFFLFEDKWAVSGAQPAEVLSAALAEVARELG